MAGVTAPFLREIEELLRPDVLVDQLTVDRSPGWSGTYLLAIRLDGPVRFARARLAHVFEPGWYAYAGSAYGPGGVGARLRRHFSRAKKPHWHVDDLTMSGGIVAAAALRDGLECDIVAGLAGNAGFRTALAGFGSSDCRRCRSHLLEWHEALL